MKLIKCKANPLDLDVSHERLFESVVSLFWQYDSIQMRTRTGDNR